MRTDAIERWSDELARNPGSLAFLPLGEELRRRHRLEEARRVALLGLERHPYRPDAHDLLARIWVDLGDEQRARDEWEMALELDASHLSSLKGLGFLAYRRRDLPGAERLLRAARARDPKDPGLQAALQRVHEALHGTRGASGNGTSHGPEQSRGNGLGQGPSHRNGEPTVGVHETAPATGAGASVASGEGAVDVAAEPRAGARARTLFAPILGEDDCTALLLDRDGLVLAGAYVDETGADVADAVGAQLAGVGDEAARALGHLGLGAWESLLVDAEHATLALGPAHEGALVLVAAGPEAQMGFVRRLLERARRRAATWMEAS